MENNLGPFIVQCVRAYFALLGHAKKMNPSTCNLGRNVIEPIFYSLRAEMANEKSSLEAFMQSCVYPSENHWYDVYVPEKLFFLTYQKWCIETNAQYSKPVKSEITAVSKQNQMMTPMLTPYFVV